MNEWMTVYRSLNEKIFPILTGPHINDEFYEETNWLYLGDQNIWLYLGNQNCWYSVNPDPIQNQKSPDLIIALIKIWLPGSEKSDVFSDFLFLWFIYIFVTFHFLFPNSKPILEVYSNSTFGKCIIPQLYSVKVG